MAKLIESLAAIALAVYLTSLIWSWASWVGAVVIGLVAFGFIVEAFTGDLKYDPASGRLKKG